MSLQNRLRAALVAVVAVIATLLVNPTPAHAGNTGGNRFSVEDLVQGALCAGAIVDGAPEDFYEKCVDTGILEDDREVLFWPLTGNEGRSRGGAGGA